MAVAPLFGDIAVTIPAAVIDFENRQPFVRRTTRERRHMMEVLLRGDPSDKAWMVLRWLQTSPDCLLLVRQQLARRAERIARRQATEPARRARRLARLRMARAAWAEDRRQADNARRRAHRLRALGEAAVDE